MLLSRAKGAMRPFAVQTFRSMGYSIASPSLVTSLLSTEAVATDSITSTRVACLLGTGTLKLTQLDRLVRVRGEGKWFSALERDWLILTNPKGESEKHAAHVCVSRRGPVVLVNTSLEKARQDILDHIYARGVSSPMTLGYRRMSDDTVVKVDPSLSTPHLIRNGELTVRRLDLDTVRVLSSVMAASVHIQYLEDATDALHTSLEDLNQRISTGQLGSLPRQDLVRLLVRNSRIRDLLTLSGMRGSPRPGTAAWQDSRYSQLWDDLDAEFELEERQEDLEKRLQHAMSLLRFAMSQKEERTETRLEWWVIVLLTIEVGISLIELLTKEKHEQEETHTHA